MENIQCVLDEKNLHRVLDFMQNDLHMHINCNSVNLIEPVYNLSRDEYQQLLETHKDVIKDWVKSYVAQHKDSSIGGVAFDFAEKCRLQRTSCMHAGTGSNDFEAVWAKKLIEDMVKKHELKQTEHVHFDGTQYTTLSVAEKVYATEWLDTPASDGHFCIVKHTENASVVIHRDEHGKYQAIARSKSHFSKPKPLYKGKNLNEAKKAGEAYLTGKTILMR